MLTSVDRAPREACIRRADPALPQLPARTGSPRGWYVSYYDRAGTMVLVTTDSAPVASAVAYRHGALLHVDDAPAAGTVADGLRLPEHDPETRPCVTPIALPAMLLSPVVERALRELGVLGAGDDAWNLPLFAWRLAVRWARGPAEWDTSYDRAAARALALALADGDRAGAERAALWFTDPGEAMERALREARVMMAVRTCEAVLDRETEVAA